MVRSPAKLLFALIPALLAAGCGGGTADVTGAITFNGMLVKSGSVTVRTSDGAVYAGTIQDGVYAVYGVPSGEVQFAVASPNPSTQPVIASAPGESPGRASPFDGKAAAAAKKLSEGWFAIPAKFGNPESSGLSTTLKAGPNTFALTITDR
jgi:hypothetical protein